jgi:hypothetical protein
MQEIERAWGEPKEGDESHVSVLVPYLQYQKWYVQDDSPKHGNDVWRIIEAEKDRLDDSPVIVVGMDWGKFFQKQGLVDITKRIGWCSTHERYTVPFAPGYNFLATPGNAGRICSTARRGRREGGGR